eukprot:TRINITY_DN13239_c0_g1_i1.p1 TRINITY_DN13239_c0_g1~~TRINITY_DN13239_c0_g1_i1.p1  ORF type:complete len:195 (+),score=40.28 TRINITY_DN13239_c0_g1_i1:54-638(+)
MGNVINVKEESKKAKKIAPELLGHEGFEKLKEDWCNVLGVPFTKNEQDIIIPQIKDFGSTSINREQFTQLMPARTPAEMDALFRMYDLDHNGSVNWREYLCIITKIIGGTLEEKIKLVFNAFDDNRNGSLSKKEFVSAVIKFSTAENPGPLAETVFVECDTNRDGKISFQEFYAWVQNHQNTFSQLVGALYIID